MHACAYERMCWFVPPELDAATLTSSVRTGGRSSGAARSALPAVRHCALTAKSPPPHNVPGSLYPLNEGASALEMWQNPLQKSKGKIEASAVSWRFSGSQIQDRLLMCSLFNHHDVFVFHNRIVSPLTARFLLSLSLFRSLFLSRSPSLWEKKTRGCYKPLSGRGEAEVERCGRSRDGRGRGEKELAL